MGADICNSTTISSNQFQSTFQFICSEDPHEKDVTHHQSLTCKNAQLQKILSQFEEQLKTSKTLYRDNHHKSQNLSLKSKNKEIKCVYQRPYKFLSDNDRIYKIGCRQFFNSDQVLVKDQVMQYFGTFLCFLAENSHYIDKIIRTNQNSYGLQVLDLNINGKRQSILIDDLILCSNNSPVFAQPIQNKYMWPCLIEKAWLKYKGAHMRKIIKASPEQVFETFFNFPLQKIVFQGETQSKIKDKLHIYFNEQQSNPFILTTKQNPKHKIGLSGKQHFYLLKVLKFEGKKLFYCRNPIGSFDFRGYYSSISEPIKRLILMQSKKNDIPDGNFVIDEDQFIQQISWATIIHHKQCNQIVSESITFENNKQFFISFDIKQPGYLCLGLSQLFDKKQQLTENYSPITYHLININKNQLIAGKQNQEGCFGIKNLYFIPEVFKKVDPGKYLLRLKKKNSRQNIRNQCLLFNSFTKPLKFSYANQQQLYRNYLAFLKNEAQHQLKTKMQHQSSNKKINRQDFDHVIHWLGDVVVVYIEKTNLKKKSIKIEVSFPELVNLTCISDNLKKGEFKNYELQNYLMIIFEKIDLTQATQVQKYTIEAY